MNKNPKVIDFNTDKFALDANVIIAFFESGQIKILEGIFKNKIYFPSEVIKELRRYDLSIFNYEISSIKNPDEFEYFINVSGNNTGLSIADVELITVSKFNNLVCITFEKKIRALCDKYEIKNIGLLKILSEAIKVNIIAYEEVKEIMKNLKNSGMYLSEDIYAEILKKIGNN